MVPHLGHDVRRWLADREQQRGKRPPQRVRCETLRKHLDPIRGELLIRSLDALGEYPLAEAVVILASASRGGEHERVWRRVQPSAVVRELVTQRGNDVDDPLPCIRLGGPHGDRPAIEVYVAPPQGQGLADPQPGEDQRREQGAALARFTVASRSSSPAASRTSMCSARSIHDRRGATARSLRRAGLRPMISYSTAVSS